MTHSARSPRRSSAWGGGLRDVLRGIQSGAGKFESSRADILRAVSSDGLNWTKEAEPVIASGARRLGCREVVRDVPHPSAGNSESDPRYRMFYEACDGTATNARGVWRIAAATSVPNSAP